jgi:lauroyl/myristoyl acyltransferase
LARNAYRAAGPLARCASRLLPERAHPGLGAYRVISHLGLAPGRLRFCAAVLESSLQSSILHRHLASLDERSLRAFTQDCVDYEGGTAPERLLLERRPLILATPHYGAPLAGLVAGASLLRDRRTLNVIYDRVRHGARLDSFLLRAGLQPGALLAGKSGIRASLRALDRCECVALLPDAFDDIAHTLVVPFFNRLLRIASGTAYLAWRSGALIVPCFAIPRRNFGLRVLLGEPIDPCRVTAEEEAQGIFTLSHALFSRIEEQLRFEPEHWRYWNRLAHVSTPLGAQGPLSDREILHALDRRMHALPPALGRIPELEDLLR